MHAHSTIYHLPSPLNATPDPRNACFEYGKVTSLFLRIQSFLLFILPPVSLYELPFPFFFSQTAFLGAG